MSKVLCMDKTKYRHQKLCPGERCESKLAKKELHIASLSTSSVRLNNMASKRLKEEVFPIMTCEISEIAQNDNLIISLGNL